MDATFWALVGLIIFFGVIIYLKVPEKITGSLDKRADGIRKELEDARRLREEAQTLLAEIQRKRKSAESEADDIIAQAKVEAERMTEETNAALAEMLDRRTKAAELKIAQAENLAVAEVRSTAADVAVAAAEHLLAQKSKGKVADDLIAKSIDEVKTRLN